MKDIFYRSTRNGDVRVPASKAILQGLSEDGGLFVPEEIPCFDRPLNDFCSMDYKQTAYEVMKLFLTDFTEEELRRCIDGAYDSKFDIPEITTLKETKDAAYLELFHGKTIAFKDMALSILPYLVTEAAKKNEMTKEIVILTATSGDTGKAALAGFADVPGTKIIVFYPKHGVSKVQERQMVTQKGANTHVIGIEGNFDDAQSGVKAIFSDPQLRGMMSDAGFMFSSANSINIGRLVPQIVYYVYAYAKMVSLGRINVGEKLDFVVPTGNFGNILAAYYASKMGLPVNRLICASNENRVLTDFFTEGVYDKNRPFVLTSSPSMDILISSNLERLIYEIAGEDAKVNEALMAQLSKMGRYTITDEMRDKLCLFRAGCASEKETAEEIRRVFEDSGYVLDPHTAVASRVYCAYAEETGDKTPAVIASTASPYKFSGSVMKALGMDEESEDIFAQAERLERISGTPVPQAVSELKDAPVLHNTIIAPENMKQTVMNILGL